MKLYYAPGACSLSPHIVLRETGVAFDLERVDIATGRTQNGEEYSKVNPRGYVPALRLDGGEVLTEGAAIVQFIADQHPEKGLAPANGTLERARLQERLNFIASELHKAFSPLFNPATSGEAKATATANITRRLGHVEQMLSDGRPYLLGDRFSVADAYLFTVTSWTGHVGIGLEKWPNLAAYMKKIADRPSVQSAMRAEGLIAA